MQRTGGGRSRSGRWRWSWRWSWARSGGRGRAFQSEGFRTRAERGSTARCAVQRAPLLLIIRNTLALRVGNTCLLACLQAHRFAWEPSQLHLAVVDVANPIETGLPPLKNSSDND